MSNLYEHTLTMQYVRDMVLLEPVDGPVDNRPLQEKLAKYSKYSGPIDDAAQAIAPVLSKSEKEKIDRISKAILERYKST